MVKAICLGELLIDFVSTETDCAVADAPAFAKKPGGAPANVACGLAKLGTPAGFIGKVGDDSFGSYLRRVLISNGVDTTLLCVDEYARTTLAFAGVRSDGKKDFFFYRNPGADQRLRPDDIDPGYFAGAAAFHFGSISLGSPDSKAATLRAIELARDHRMLVSYDPNYRPALWPDDETAHGEILEGFRHSHLAKVSDEEWPFVTGTDDFAEGAKLLRSLGPEVIVVSCGDKGAYVNTPAGERFVPGYRVKLVEPTGAGDAFVAMILAELIRLRPSAGLASISLDRWHDMISLANAAGALCCTKVGAIPALPTRDMVDEFLRKME